MSIGGSSAPINNTDSNVDTNVKEEDNDEDDFGDFTEASTTSVDVGGVQNKNGEDEIDDDFGDFTSAKEKATGNDVNLNDMPASTAIQNVVDSLNVTEQTKKEPEIDMFNNEQEVKEEVVDNVFDDKDQKDNADDFGDFNDAEGGDGDDFGDFNDATDSIVKKASEDTVALNASLIDSFVTEKVPSPKNENDIFSNLADFALSGTPVSSDSFSSNKQNNQNGDNNLVDSNVDRRRVERVLSVGLAEADLSFLPAMENRGRFEGPLEQLVPELIEQQRFLEASRCKKYIDTLAGAAEDFATTNPWRDIRPTETIVKFSDLKNEIIDICGENGMLNKRFCQLFPYSLESNLNDLTELASSDLPKVLLLLKKASLLRTVIVGINEPMGRYENYPDHWMSILRHCKKEFIKAQSFVDKVTYASKKINAEGSFRKQISVAEVLKEEKVVKYFKCLFAMYKVCCSLQLWIVYQEKARKDLLIEMETLKKGWKKLGLTVKKYGMDFPRIKMITYKHIDEGDIDSKNMENDDDEKGGICHLSLLPLRKNDSRVIYAGNTYISECVNLWVNSISTTPP